MRPDVARFGVYAKHGLEARSNRRQRWPMTFEKKIVVAQPVRERVMWHRFPARVPHVLGEEFDLFGAILRHVEQVQFGR